MTLMPDYKKLKQHHMSTNNHHNVSEKELDNLLNQAFLNLDFTNPKNKELMETISNYAMNMEPAGTGIFNRSLFTKTTGIFILATATLITCFILFTTNKSKSTSLPETTIAKKEPVQTETQKVIVVTKTADRPKERVIITKKQPKTAEITREQKAMMPPAEPQKKQHAPPAYEDNKKIKPEDSSYVFPKLTEKEIKATKKQKQIIAMCIAKPGKSKYMLVHGNLMTDSISAFYIQDAEVSNLEYRTFLFDLLIQGRKSEFLIAKPYQHLWLNANGTGKFNRLTDLYFSNKRFDDYPVVNISPEGAELYCKWLMEIGKEEHKEIIAGLPTKKEWTKAARSGSVTAAYPWGTDSIQNKKGCFMANFCIKKLHEKLNSKVSCDPKKYPGAYTSAGLMLGDTISTAEVYAYNPNHYKLYCMSGNAAEMVYNDPDKKTVTTKGGSWNSDLEHCRIGSEEELTGPLKANPMTGFRPVFRLVVHNMFGDMERDDEKTGIATLTPEEIKTVEKDKAKMLNQLIKLNKDKYAYIPMGSCEYKQKMVSVEAFYMETTEVTNLEYRTFLADLLIQKRDADYLAAKPDQMMWIKRFPYSYNEPMANMYFWHPAYNEYPVVNIPVKGAQLYCDWLTIETNKLLQLAGKPLMNDLRIPDEYEWAMAASNGKNKVKYASGNTFLRDSKGRYEMNYMCYSKEECRYDSTLSLYVPKVFKQQYMEDGAFHTAYTKSYAPNSYGLYCMAGNVAEMIKHNGTNTPGIKGGSWFSCDHFLEIEAEDEFKNEIDRSPLIGFRPVFTALKK
jgi:formylglycine-generating enzyme required for sulfatase activity